MARRHPATVLVISTVLVLAGCGDDRSDAGGPRTPVETSSSRPLDDAAGTSTPAQAPEVTEQLRFTAKTLDGKEFSGESLALGVRDGATLRVV